MHGNTDTIVGQAAQEAPIAPSMRAALAAGDATAWERVYRDVQGPLYGYCRKLAGSEHDALDLLHDAFANTMRACRGGSVPDRLRPYLFTAARNLHVRSRTRASREHEGGADDVAATAPAEPRLEDAPELGALVSAQRGDVLAALDELPDRQRAALALVEMEGCSYAEVGEALDLDENAVAQLLFRARAKLKLLLRLREVDESSMPDECRRRLPDISKLLDDGLKQPAMGVLVEHIALCDHCTRARADMQLVRERYRAFVPALPISAAGGWEQLAEQAAAGDMPFEQEPLSADEAPGDEDTGDRSMQDHEPAPHGPGPGTKVAAGAAVALLVAVAAFWMLREDDGVVAARYAGNGDSAARSKGDRPGDDPASSQYRPRDTENGGASDVRPDDPGNTPDIEPDPAPEPGADPEPRPDTEPEPDPTGDDPPPTTDEPDPDPALPNLVATGVRWTGSGATVTVSNTGTGDAGGTTVSFTIGTTSYTASLGPVPAGGSSSASTSAPCREGTFDVSATIDPGGAVAESNESDNTASANATAIC